MLMGWVVVFYNPTFYVCEVLEDIFCRWMTKVFILKIKRFLSRTQLNISRLKKTYLDDFC